MEFVDMILTPKLDNVIMHGPFHEPVDGTLCITGHHLILSSRKEGVEELWLLHQNIDCIERKPNNAQGGGIIVIKCKDFRIIQLEISQNEDFNNVVQSIEQLLTIDELTKRYPFFFRPMYPILEDGWTLFRPETEFSKLIQGEEWRLTHVNSDFQICPTYPNILLVPKNIDDETIIAAAKFREGGRFPVLSYKHESGGVLMRSSQPLTGPNSKRCKDDERLLNSVLGPGTRGYIIDTRNSNIAQSAKNKGGGFEMEIFYPQWRRVVKPIDRHHVLSDSLSKLVDACNDTTCTMDKWLIRMDSSNWLTHLKDTLNCACLVAQCLDQDNTSVLVHGSEGLDATLLVTSLAQIILNPDCRTVRGFEALIEREWLQAGHPFSTRHAQSCYSPRRAPKSQAPTFLLFLDSVAQIQTQFPCSFEFSNGFLVTLFENSYASQYGTFLGNCEADRQRIQLSKRTTSLWSYLNRPDILQTFLNPMYEPINKVIWPTVAPVSLTLWTELFCRWVVEQREQSEAWKSIAALKEKDKELRLKASRLRRQLIDLEKEAARLGVATTG
ncbi:myotubularin-related protein 9 [Nilaparvata lugens]|uniref:myotubularin-related protein 9 n=1 Tax=Nilaparvata lugens TaxID=108931 RepID=UPI00193E4477|nr:myotubularin-related protein 9 [Nilaparvata lugens]